MQTKNIWASTRTVHQKANKGFSLVELMTAITIIGILSAISTPSLISQLLQGRQSEAETLIAQLITQASAYNDEYGIAPSSWKDLDEVATIPTRDGAASTENFAAITTPSGNYSISTTQSNNKYTFIATPKDTNAAKYNVVGCSNVATGASQIISGDSQAAASTGNLKC